jgi:hypothetical protein
MNIEPRTTHCILLEDGSLQLEVEPGLLSLVERWLPRLPLRPTSAAEAIATIDVVRGHPIGIEAPTDEPTLELGTVVAWVVPEDEGVLLRGSGGNREGLVDLAGLRATLRAGLEESTAARSDIYSMLTVSAALLLGRLNRALLHAAAVETPSGEGWILAGDARSGKSTTCLNLIQSGWDYLSDDQVVLYRNATTDSFCIEGWARPFHVDEGWQEGTPGGRRVTFDPAALRSGAWRKTTVLSGVILTEVRPDRATELEPLAPTDALVGLIRQSPWLLADRAVAPSMLEMLRRVASGAAFRLFLGRDTYRDGGRLLQCLRPLLADG